MLTQLFFMMFILAGIVLISATALIPIMVMVATATGDKSYFKKKIDRLL